MLLSCFKLAWGWGGGAKVFKFPLGLMALATPTASIHVCILQIVRAFQVFQWFKGFETVANRRHRKTSLNKNFMWLWLTWLWLKWLFRNILERFICKSRHKVLGIKITVYITSCNVHHISYNKASVLCPFIYRNVPVQRRIAESVLPTFPRPISNLYTLQVMKMSG